jgi:hypothetical protein
MFSEEHKVRFFKNRVLSVTLGPKMEEGRRGFRKLQNGELHSLYSYSDIVKALKSRNMRWAERVARKEEKTNAQYFSDEG